MAELLIDYNTGTGSRYEYAGSAWYSQVFQHNRAFNMTRVGILSRKYGDPGTVLVKIRATTSGVPSGPDLASVEITLTTSGTFHYVDIDLPGLSGYVQYAVIFCAPDGDASNKLYWYMKAPGAYSGGNPAVASNGVPPWTSLGATLDFGFRIYGDEVAWCETYPAENIRARAATGRGLVYVDGVIYIASDITEIGFEWGTTLGGPYPDSVTDTPDITEAGVFSLEMDDPALTPDTTYYYRAKMLHNVDGWLYGNEETFKTLKPLPIVQTQWPTAKAETTATTKAEILSIGDSDVTKRGFVYGLTSQSNPGNVAPGASGYDSYEEETPGPYAIGEYTLDLTGLTQNKLYYYRAFAQNTDGYDYGGQLLLLTNSKVDFLFPYIDSSKGIRFDSSPGGGYPNPYGGEVAHCYLCLYEDTAFVYTGVWGYLTGNYVFERLYYNDNYHTDLFSLTNPIIRDTAIMKVKWKASLFKNAWPYGKFKRAIRTHGTTYAGAATDISVGNPDRRCEVFYTNPNTGNAWTLAELDALAAGVSLGAGDLWGTPACDMIRVAALWANAEVTNDGYIDIGEGDIRLKGNIVEDEAEASTVYFEWGETVAYGSQTDDQTDKEKGGDFTADVTVPEGGVVHFRPVIVTACGETFYGEDFKYDVNQPNQAGIWLGDEDDWFQLEITAYVLGAISEIGWDDELSEATAGIATLTLDNHLGYFSPDNTDSPFFGYLYEGARITIREIYKTILYPVFTGRIDRINPHSEPENAICYVQVLDGMDDMAGTTISTALFEDTNAGELMAAVLDEAAWPAGRRDIDTGIDDLTLGWFHKQLALRSIRTLETIEMGRAWVKPNGNFRFENRHARITGDGLISQATFDDTMVEFTPEYSKRLVKNDIQVTGRRYFAGGVQLFSGYDMATIDSDLIWSAHAGDDAAPYIPQASTVVMWAEFNAPLASYTALVQGTNWNANTEADGTGTDASASITIEERQYGQAIRLTITNAGSVGVYLTPPDSPLLGAPTDRTLLVYGALYSVENITFIEEDTASQGTYGKRSLPVDTPFKANPYDLLAYAQFLKERRAAPVPTISAKFVARTAWPDDTIYIATLALHISDRITASSALLGINGDFYINKVVQEYVHNEAGFVRETTWTLEAAEGSAEGVYWLLGVAGFGELGETTRLGF